MARDNGDLSCSQAPPKELGVSCCPWPLQNIAAILIPNKMSCSEGGKCGVSSKCNELSLVRHQTGKGYQNLIAGK